MLKPCPEKDPLPFEERFSEKKCFLIFRLQNGPLDLLTPPSDTEFRGGAHGTHQKPKQCHQISKNQEKHFFRNPVFKG